MFTLGTFLTVIRENNRTISPTYFPSLTYIQALHSLKAERLRTATVKLRLRICSVGAGSSLFARMEVYAMHLTKIETK